ncbi:ComF family protein [Patescibacteria group bacterium]
MKTILEHYCLDFIFPKECLACGIEGRSLCQACLKALPRLNIQRCPTCLKNTGGQTCPHCRKQTRLDSAYSLLDYSHPFVRKLCNALKHEGVVELASLFSNDLAQLLHEQKIFVDTVIPIPLSPQRLRERGYNQASLIAKPLAHLLCADLAEDILLRTRNTKPQQNLKKSERLTNLKGALSVARKVTNKNILLVDDVLTSGATLSYAANLLHNNGAKNIYGLSLARGRLT